MGVAAAAAAGCVFPFFQLSGATELLFPGWAAIGLFVCHACGRNCSHMAAALRTRTA